MSRLDTVLCAYGDGMPWPGSATVGNGRHYAEIPAPGWDLLPRPVAVNAVPMSHSRRTYDPSLS